MQVIKFSQFFKVAWVLSASFIILGFVITFMKGGFSFGIDLSSGFFARVSLNHEKPIDVLRSSLEKEMGEEIQVQGAGKSSKNNKTEVASFSIRGKIPNDVSSFDFAHLLEEKLINSLTKLDKALEIQVEEVSLIDPSFSKTLIGRTIILVIIVLALILLYIALRFQWSYGISAVLGLIHDLLAVIAFIGISGTEISIPVIVSVLTMIGYSLNDTVVIFDRVRERMQLKEKKPFIQTLNESLSQTLSRTIIISFTTFMALSMVAIFTQGTVRDFAVIFLVAIVIGTYSSLFIASSFLKVFFERRYFNKLISKDHVSQIKFQKR